MKIYWYGESKNVIGKKVKELRKQAGMTQKELAEKLQLCGLDIEAITVLRIENGTRFVPDYELKVIANFFQVSYAVLLDG